MDCHSVYMGRRDAGGSGYGRVNFKLFEIGNIAVDSVRLARPRLAGQKNISPRFKY
jgi:hypothetical protein